MTDFKNDPIDAGSYIRTFTGKYVNPFSMTADDIDIRDIAHALSMMCRFGGHCKNFYSVAQHSLMVAYAVQDDLALDGLLHDASEAYLVDMPSPIKENLKEYCEIENKIMTMVAEKFGITWPVHDEVKRWDRASLEWEWDNNVVIEKSTLMPLVQKDVEEVFLETFKHLMNEKEKSK